MERYHDFQIKDHYFWTDAAPEYITKEEGQAARPKPEPQAPKAETSKPRYKNWTVRESDGSLSYYSARVSQGPVIIDGYAI